MADISKLKLPNNSTYDIKDATGRAYIGDLSALTTTAKDDLVGAINEIAESGGNGVTGVKGNAESSYRKGNVNMTPANIGLGNVNNTSDANKPVSVAQQAALNLKQDKLTFDTAPTSGSNNPVTSGGVYNAIYGAINTLLATSY